MRRALGTVCLCVACLSFGALALRAFAAEPSPKGNGALDPNDPLLKALEQVQQEVDALRRESGAGMARPKSSGGGMAGPSMPAPNLPSPGMPRTVTKGTPRAAPLVSGGGPAPQGREIGPAPRSIATPRTLPPATKETTPIWSFQPLKAPAVPQPSDTVSPGNTVWPRDDVDRFVLARLEAAKITPNPEADAAALCRRVTFDLTGLPPKRNSRRSSRPRIATKPTRRWSIGCSRPPGSASVGLGTGSTSYATPIASVAPGMLRSPTRGAIATM